MQGVQHVPAVSKINIYTVIRCDTRASDRAVVLAAVTANAASNPSLLLLRQEININVNARAPKSKMCQSEFSYHNKVNNRTAVPRSHLL